MRRQVVALLMSSCACVQIYVRVMMSECKLDSRQMEQMFPNLERLIEFHTRLLDDLVERYKTSPRKFVQVIGDILLKTLSDKCDDIIDIYSKVCCTHLNAKSVYKSLSMSSKPFMSFLQVVHLKKKCFFFLLGH